MTKRNLVDRISALQLRVNKLREELGSELGFNIAGHLSDAYRHLGNARETALMLPDDPPKLQYPCSNDEWHLKLDRPWYDRCPTCGGRTINSLDEIG